MEFPHYYDGRPCKACTSAEEMLMWGKKVAQKKGVNGSQAEASTSHASPRDRRERRTDCPLNTDELGRSTWNLLHTMAAYYPDKPSEAEKKTMADTLTGLSKTYPCPHCAEDFRKDIAQNPPSLQNKEKLSRWMCELHNRVNVKLGKDVFDCNRTMERWLDGWKDGSCDY